MRIMRKVTRKTVLFFSNVHVSLTFHLLHVFLQHSLGLCVCLCVTAYSLNFTFPIFFVEDDLDDADFEPDYAEAGKSIKNKVIP